MSSDFVFRKAAFGGFNRDDVISYINEAKINEAKLETEKNIAEKRAEDLADEIEALKAKINELTSENDAKKAYTQLCQIWKESYLLKTT